MTNEAGRPLRVLFLAFEFPPLTAAGVFRALGFAEQFAACGIELDIVTVRESDYATWSGAPIDPGLARRIPPEARVHRIPSGFPAWYWSLARNKLGFRLAQYAHWGDPLSSFWRRPLFAALDRLVAERRPDVLLATAPPFGVAVLAADVARRYRLPWVVDWRDPWLLWCSAPMPSYAHFRHVRATEGALLREANVSVATSHVTRDDWVRYFPGVDPARLVTIYNGYDRAALAAPVAALPGDGRRRIAYAGSFYFDPRTREAMRRPLWRRPPYQWLFYTPRREDWLYRSPYFFLRGLRRLADRVPGLKDKLVVEFAGLVPSWLPAMLRETGTESFVELLGPVPHAEALALQGRADAVLLTSAKVEGGRDYSVAGKTFEYFGLRRPILGVLTDGAMRDLVEQSGLGILADPDDTESVARAIEQVVSGTADVTPNENFLAECDRANSARQMAAVLRRAADEGYRDA
jgi:glycosyltransferase involved in cell wall biosynthesis